MKIHLVSLGRLEPRLRAKIVLDRASGCWLWTGSKTGSGYGHIHRQALGFIQAHRVVYEALVGLIPEGYDLDHLCRTRLCVNPRHLEPVTRRENLMRGPTTRPSINAAKTHCPQGHEYTPSNTYVYPTGRVCRECTLDRASARYYRLKVS